MMRKLLTVSLILLPLLFRISGIAFAAEAACAEIPVVIDGGGMAYMIPEVNCPLPVENAVRVDNGRTGLFHIDFTEAGEYHYMISAMFSHTDGEKKPADEVFRLKVTVSEKEDGSLYAVAVINSEQTAEKTDVVRFRETPGKTDPVRYRKYPENPTEPADEPSASQPEEPELPPEEPSTASSFPSLPRTGDESHLTHYVLLAIAASAGLFGLSVLYTVNTNKLVNKDRV